MWLDEGGGGLVEGLNMGMVVSRCRRRGMGWVRVLRHEGG